MLRQNFGKIHSPYWPFAKHIYTLLHFIADPPSFINRFKFFKMSTGKSPTQQGFIALYITCTRF